MIVMIDWFGLFANSLWIFACALALSTLSYGSWKASINKTKLRIYLNGLEYQRAFNFSGILFCIGLALTSDRLLETILWGILAALFLISLILTWKNAPENADKPD
jgi:hypothetical protein